MTRYILAFIAALTPIPAMAQQMNCGTTESLEAMLSVDYGEFQLFAAPSGRNSALLYRLFINPETGTWTAVITDPRESCILDSGTGFAFTPDAAPQGSPA